MRLNFSRFKTSVIALGIASALAIGSAPAFARDSRGGFDIRISPGDVADWMSLYMQYRDYQDYKKDRREWRKHMKRHHRDRDYRYYNYGPYYGNPYGYYPY